jgi:hypothetical protein
MAHSAPINESSRGKQYGADSQPQIGAAVVIPPREFPEYTPTGYYALFFKDPDGIRYEIVTH